MIKILGIFDILTALLFLINNFDKSDAWFPNKIVLIAGIYLLIKGVLFLFILDFASSLDVISAVIILLSLVISIHPVLSLIVIIFLVQKGIFSLLS